MALGLWHWVYGTGSSDTGCMALGLVTLGLVALGLVALGLVTLGLVALGLVALGHLQCMVISYYWVCLMHSMGGGGV